GLLAHVLVSKYADHLPLYRQSQIYAGEGVERERSTLADWVGKSMALLLPLVDTIGRHVMAGAAHADDAPSTCLLLAPARRRLDGCGSISVTSGIGVARHPRRPGIASLRIARQMAQRAPQGLRGLAPCRWLCWVRGALQQRPDQGGRPPGACPAQVLRHP